MTPSYDVIVVGLGGMGSATAYQLAQRGKRVLGLEQFAPGHSQGSSHGQSRIIRLAYFEDPTYVPLLRRAYELWEQLEHDTGQPGHLLTLTGGLMLGHPTSEVVAGSIRSARQHTLPHEILDAPALRRHFPPLTPNDDTLALYEPQAGFVHPEETVLAHIARATHLGADLRFNEPVTAWHAAAAGDRVQVTTAKGRYEAERLVLAPGAWAPQLLADLGVPFVIERQVMYWFDPVGGIAPFLPDRFPIYIWELEENLTIYGFPAQGGPAEGVKIAIFYLENAECTPATIDRTVHPAEIAHIRGCIADHIPALNSTCLNAVTCLYTNTPDKHFVIGPHPSHPQVIVGAGFSGHGYKFASVVGEILADHASDGTTHHAVELFAPGRF